MSVAMFIALPVSFSVLLLTSDIQRKLGQTQIAAKIRSGSRMEEYLQGIRVIKAYNMTGKKFARLDRKSTRLNSSHANISYAVFCLKKKTPVQARSRRRKAPASLHRTPPVPPPERRRRHPRETLHPQRHRRADLRVR